MLRWLHMSQTWTIHDPTELKNVAVALLQEQPRVLALVGPLGAGKTTLTQALGRELGIHEQVTSPTYVLQQIYRISNHPPYDTLVHVDCYRINADYEVPALDLEYWVQRPKTLIVIEWADRIKKHLAGFQPVWLTFQVRGTERKLTIS